ncbi:S8 family peptidase [Actinacidiphila glaucinigra]|uniref:S8 family peptidase n=1 Tax=Actinacidiphila glaucinigra TaxID=235986 RepID=UPI0029A9A0D6|nr:S8 family serine peptidase [Streptomyces sp. PA03-3a]
MHMNNRWRAGVTSPRPQLVAATALAALLAGLTVTPGAAHGTEPRDVAAQSRAADAEGITRHQVTLITGDRVTLDTDPAGGRSVSVQPAEGREDIRFIKRQDGGEWTVIPADALPLLAAGRVDRALFNVSALVKGKYAERKSLPLIVRYTGDAGTAERRLTAAGAGGVDTIDGTSFATLSERRQDAGAFWKGIAPGRAGATAFGAGVQHVWLDGRAKVQLDRTVPRIGAPHAWEKGLTGDGVEVAVLDTGYDPGHPDLKGLVVDSANFTDEPDAADGHGHGTHVASTVAGSGAASGGRYKGVAPGARIIAGKVCTADGNCDNSDIIEGLAWAARHGAKVINLSLGDTDTPETDAVEAMVDTVTRDYGTLVVAAAGNNGSGSRVSSPASAGRALAVGAAEADDDRAEFSSVGPRTGDSGLKPDLIAPGVNITAAMAGGTTAEDGYTMMSGTSMATPHVAGAAAIVFQQHPDWTPEQVKRQLMQSTTGAKEHGAYYQGAGRVDVARAVDQQVAAEPASVDFGLVEWTDGERPPVTKTITYRNPGAAPVTLHLTHNAARGATDEPAPQGLFRLGADQVTVPAGGTSDVTFTVDPQATTEYAAYSGVVRATTADGGVSVRVPFGMDLEQPSHELRLNLKDRAGKAPEYAYLLIDSADGRTYERELLGEAGTTLRLPNGTYSVSGFFFGGDFTEATVVGVPKVVTTADRSATIDARAAEPVAISAPSRTARIISTEIGTISQGDGLLSVTVNDAVGDDHIENLYATPTARYKDSKFTYLVNSVWGEPSPGGGNPPSAYYLTRPVHGAIPADPGYRPRRSELAEVNTTFAATAPGTTATRLLYMYVDNVRFALQRMDGLRVPDRRVDYFSSADGLRWQTGFDQWNIFDPDSPRGQMYLGTLRGYRSGAAFEERWNQGVQAVGFSPEYMDNFRDGDDLWIGVQDAANGGMDLVAGTSTSRQPKWELWRNGEAVPDFYGYATVPGDPAPADYRLAIDQERDLAPLSSVSTKLRAEWRFRSQTTATPQALPLYAVRMAPELDEWNRARSGREFRIPVLIQRPVGATRIAIRTFTTEVSYDEGRTWRPAEVTGSGTERTVTVDHPRHASGGSVSLRTYVKDAAGNTFKQTVVKAYLLK